jgi:hypothetical protein
MAASIKRILPVVRNQGVPIAGLVQFGQWIDAIALAAGAGAQPQSRQLSPMA